MAVVGFGCCCTASNEEPLHPAAPTHGARQLRSAARDGGAALRLGGLQRGGALPAPTALSSRNHAHATIPGTSPIRPRACLRHSDGARASRDARDRRATNQGGCQRDTAARITLSSSTTRLVWAQRRLRSPKNGGGAAISCGDPSIAAPPLSCKGSAEAAQRRHPPGTQSRERRSRSAQKGELRKVMFRVMFHFVMMVYGSVFE